MFTACFYEILLILGTISVSVLLLRPTKPPILCPGIELEQSMKVKPLSGMSNFRPLDQRGSQYFIHFSNCIHIVICSVNVHRGDVFNSFNIQDISENV
ncbi:hypothetical protein SFRURICE_009766 [Spodoptera frugiperda]|nr:hypothetical protein SFRURICE_009766 [Spodoptera frugiperda]